MPDRLVPVRLGDGNAFAILGACRRAWIRAGRPSGDWVRIREEATSGDYDHLLQTITLHFDVALSDDDSPTEEAP